MLFVVGLYCEITWSESAETPECFDYSTHHCASSTTSFSAAKFSSCQANASQILEQCDLWVRLIKDHFRAIEIEANGVCEGLCDRGQRSSGLV